MEPMKPQGEQGADTQAMDAYRRMGLAAMKIVYDEKVSGDLLNLVKQAGDPAEGIAAATQAVIGQMQDRMTGMDPNAVYAVAPAVAAMILELGAAAGVVPSDPGLLQAAVKAMAAKVQQQGATQAPAEAMPEQPGGGLIESAMEA